MPGWQACDYWNRLRHQPCNDFNHVPARTFTEAALATPCRVWRAALSVADNMTDAKRNQIAESVAEMLNNPALARFIHELPTGERVMDLTMVKALLESGITQTLESIEQAFDGIGWEGQL